VFFLQITLDIRCAEGHTLDVRHQTSDEKVVLVALPEELADTLLESIVDGQFPVESVLPSEGELALKYGMSRLTVREAVRTVGDPQQSRDAMEAHMNQTQADLRRYVLHVDRP